MQYFYNLKIANKLLVSFSAVLALSVLLGLFSIVQLERVNQTSTDMESNWMPSIAFASDMNTNISDLRVAELEHTLSTNERDMAAAEKQLAAVMADFEHNQSEYAKLISSPEERKIYDTFKTNWQEYLAEHMKVIEWSNAHNKQEAKALMLGKSKKEFDEASAELDKLVALNVKGGQDASHAGDVLYGQSRGWIFGVLAGTVALGLAMAVAMARIVSGQLKIAVELAQTVAAGNLSSHVEVTSRDETGQLMQALKDMNASLGSIVGQVRQGTDTIATASSQIAAGNQDLSSRTEQQAASLEETAASMEQLLSTVTSNAENARQANQMAATASDVVQRGGLAVKEAVSTMREIAQDAGRIEAIVSVIDGIAFQTNILALNAAVEAARAGEEGKGFAVVAAEVRSLAQRSASAAKEIKQLLNESGATVQAGAAQVETAGRSMEEILATVERLTLLVSDIATASREQVTGIDQVNTAVNQMDQVTQQNAALVEEAAAAASSLETQAQRLQEAVSAFRLPARIRDPRGVAIAA